MADPAARVGPEAVGEALADAAAALIGTRFRLHGRDPATGLDCVGLVHASLAAIGGAPVAPAAYTLRNLSVAPLIAFASRSGLVAATGPTRRGDVILLDLGWCQHHLGIADGPQAMIHAHAGLRRVVRQPLTGSAPIVRSWRLVPLSRT